MTGSRLAEGGRFGGKTVKSLEDSQRIVDAQLQDTKDAITNKLTRSRLQTTARIAALEPPAGSEPRPSEDDERVDSQQRGAMGASTSQCLPRSKALTDTTPLQTLQSLPPQTMDVGVTPFEIPPPTSCFKVAFPSVAETQEIAASMRGGAAPQQAQAYKEIFAKRLLSARFLPSGTELQWSREKSFTMVVSGRELISNIVAVYSGKAVDEIRAGISLRRRAGRQDEAFILAREAAHASYVPAVTETHNSIMIFTEGVIICFDFNSPEHMEAWARFLEEAMTRERGAQEDRERQDGRDQTN